MAAASPVQIICGVTCACAPAAKVEHKPDADCAAHDAKVCPYLKDGQCSCSGGLCVSSQNKKNCVHASKGDCDCAAGACKRMLEIKSDCSAAPGCGCEAGECKKTSLPIS